jgi:signal transduction histidine kinase
VIAGPIALILASGAGYLLAGLSLGQVEAMRRRAAAISAETAGERLPVPPSGDELERLGVTLNEMLDRLEAALERERDFVADAGHELRTPLASLRTELELALRQAGTSEELRAAVLEASQEVERLSQLAEALLLIARSDRGRLPLKREEIDVDELLASAVSRFEWRAHEVGKTVRALPAPGVRVEGDRIRLEQALGNLVDNALRYGGDVVELRASSAGRQTEVRVTDNGPGFPPEFIERAFDRFSRADTARGRGGTGLGLAIVRQIAEAHGGKAGAKNGQAGTDAWLTLQSD